METQSLPEQLQSFSKVFFLNGFPNSDVLFSDVLLVQNDVLLYLQERYKSVYQDKIVNEDKYIDYLYKDIVKTDQYKKYLQVNFLALIKCFSESISYLEKVNIKSGPLDSEKVNFIRKLFSEIVIFLNTFESYLNKNHIPYGFYRRNISFSYELYYSSVHHFFSYCNPLTFASITMQPLSVFQIRQAIEVRIKSALGIHVLRRTANYDLLKITPDSFIEFIYSKPNEISIDVEKRTLEKIHGWTNLYVHTGFMPEAYKTWFALKSIEPLFLHKTINGYDDRFGSITIKKDYFENYLENDIKQFVVDKFGRKLSINSITDVLIEKIEPEAVII